MEAIVSASREARLEREKAQRRANRAAELEGHYDEMTKELLRNDVNFLSHDFRFHWYKRDVFPPVEEVHKLPGVAALLDTDTETLDRQTWGTVEIEARCFAWTKRYRISKTLDHILDHGKLDDSLDIRTVTPDAISRVALECDAIAKKLQLATSLFWCTKSNQLIQYPEIVSWFPAQETNFQCVTSLSSDKSPAEAILRQLRLDPETATKEEVNEIASGGGRRGLLCSRCDIRVAPTYDFKMTVS